jgi:hypothetical protein
MKTLYWTFAALVLGVTLAVSPTSAQQNVVICTQPISGGTINNVSVPPNATCTLTNVTVQGNIKVNTNALLQTNECIAQGNIRAEGAALIFIDATSIGGNLNAVGTVSVKVDSSSIDGNVSVTGADSLIAIENNQVNGNVDVEKNNTGSGNTNVIQNNTIGGNLICTDNTPLPVDLVPEGSPNIVAGHKVGQCAGL